MLNQNIDINIVTAQNATALIPASINNYFDVSLMLLEAGINTNIFEIQSGNTPLIISVSKKYQNLSDVLLEYDANPQLKNYIGYSACDIAIVKSIQWDKLDVYCQQDEKEYGSLINFLDHDLVQE